MLIKPNKNISNEMKLIDENPLSSTVDIKRAKEALDDEEQPQVFSLFDKKGNSKAKEEVQKFQSNKQAPIFNNEVKKPNLFGFGTFSAGVTGGFKPVQFNN